MPSITKKISEKKTAAKKTATVKSDKKSQEKLTKDKTVTLKNSKTVAKTKETKSPKVEKTSKDKKLQTTAKASKTVASKAVTEKVNKESKTPKIVKSKEKVSTTKVDNKKVVDKKATVKSSKPVKESVGKVATTDKPIKKESKTSKTATIETTTTTKKVADLPVKEKEITTKSVDAGAKVKKPKKGKENIVDFIIATTLGNIDIRLFPDKAPITVSNFLRYIASDYYSNTVFHRIIRGFMIQGGGYDKTLSFKEDTLLPIKIESNNGLKNLRGTIAMARTSDPHSATSQFFINLTDNPHLDFAEETIERYGYTVFAKVTKGLDIVDKIGNSQTTTVYHHQNVPATPITIKSITNKVK